MDKSKVVKVYILLIVVHFLHVVEELLGDASLYLISTKEQRIFWLLIYYC